MRDGREHARLPGFAATRRALLCLPAAFFGPPSTARAQAERMRFSTAERPFVVHAFRAAGAGPRPAILVLGGSKGYASESYGLLASALNGAGLDAFLVDYLSPGDEAAARGAGSARARIAFYADRLADWSEAVRATVEGLRRGAPPTGFGVVGISLGAMPALSACANRADVGALAIVDGSLPDGALARIRSLPPLLTVWGAADAVFPVTAEAKLGRLARRLGGAPESVIYEGRGHAFFVDPGDADAARARAVVTAFFSAHL